MHVGGKNNRTENRKKNKRNRERVSNPFNLEPSVVSYYPQGLCDEPILVNSPLPSAHRVNEVIKDEKTTKR